MADEVELDAFQESSDDEPEIVVMGPDEKPEDREEKAQQITLTPEEYESLKSKADQNKTVADSLSGLADVITKAKAPVNAVPVPQQMKGETDDEFRARVEASIFEPGKGVDTISEISRRAIMPLFQQVLPDVAEMAEELLALRPSTSKLYEKYKDEIKQELMALPPEQRLLPKAPRWAYDRVIQKHQGDVVETEVASRVEAEIERRVKEELAKRGITTEEASDITKGQDQPARRTPQTSATKPASKRTSVYLTSAERARVERLANERGVEVVDILRAEGKLAKRR